MFPALLRLVAAIGLAALTPTAIAATSVDSVRLTYGGQVNVTSVTVPPGVTVSARVTVTHTGSASGRRWYSTAWRVGGGAFTCANHTQFNNQGTDSVTISITAPQAAATYNIQFVAWTAAGCGGGSSATFTLVNGMRVGPSPTNSTVVASPTAVAADGVSTSTITVTLRDGAGNAVAGKTVTLTAGSGSSTISAASGPSNASGVVTFTVRNTVVQSVTYSATDTTDGIALTQTATVAFTSPLAIASFNVVQPGADPVTGKIFTKIAGQNFALDIVALNAANGLMAGFTGTVGVEIVDNTSAGACNALPIVATLTNQTFTPAENGRHPLSAPNTVANVYRNAKVRIKYPAALPTIVRCSGDNFAIRPASLAIAASDANRTTAGTANALNNVTIPGGTVHNAGRPFTIRATAYNGAGMPVVTSNYDGSPSALVAACAGSACTATVGNVSVGVWGAAAGTATTTSATYDDVGAFSLQLLDSTYAAVDSVDGTSAAQLTIPSVAISVGRFVPERFVVSAASIVPRTDIAACSGSGFTYMGERMDAAFTLTAVNNAGATTTRYNGALAALVLTTPASFNLGVVDAGAPTPLTGRLATSPVPLGTSGTWTNGVATVTARIAVQRPAGTPDGPFSNVRIGIAPSDPDTVTLSALAMNLDADNSGTPERLQVGAPTALRFGRMRLQNAHGSQLTAMPVPVQVQFWNGTAFVTNTADSCTPIAAANVALGNYAALKNLGAGETSVTVATPITSGVGLLRLSAPGAANNGSVDVSVNLTGAPAGFSCSAGMGASTPSGMGYLQGAWCGASFNRDPAARATFGIFRNSDSVIYQRENY